MLLLFLIIGIAVTALLRPWLKPTSSSNIPATSFTIGPQHAFRPSQSSGSLYFVDYPADLATTDIFTRVITMTQTGAFNFTNSPDYSELLPALAPNDDRVAYITVSKGGDRGVRVLAAGSGPVDVSSRIEKRCAVGLGLAPAWSPDGAWIAFLAECDRRGGKTIQLFAARSDGSALVPLTDGDYQVTEARWLDNATLIFAARHGETAGALYRVPLANPTPAVLGAVTLPKSP